jgi:tetratricopeptide (TPR) repeat protein
MPSRWPSLRNQPESLETQRGQIVDLIQEGRLDQAAFRAGLLAERLPGEPSCAADATLVAWVRDLDLPKDRPAAWKAAFRLALSQSRGASATVALAVRRYLARGLVRAAEVTEGRGMPLAGEPSGSYLLEVDLPGEAAESLYATLAVQPGSGRGALLLANALYRMKLREEARDLYRRALRVAPFEVALEEIEDPEIRGLADLGPQLGLAGDVRAWMPVLGFLDDVLPFSALDPVPGAGFGDGTRAYDLLIAHRGARSAGERAAIRQDLRELCPALHDALVFAGKLDASGSMAGSA